MWAGKRSHNHGVYVGSGLQSTNPWISSCPCILMFYTHNDTPAMWPWASHLTSERLGFLGCKNENSSTHLWGLCRRLRVALNTLHWKLRDTAERDEKYLPCVKCTSNQIVRVVVFFLVELDKLILLFIWNYKGPTIAKIITDTWTITRSGVETGEGGGRAGVVRRGRGKRQKTILEKQLKVLK